VVLRAGGTTSTIFPASMCRSTSGSLKSWARIITVGFSGLSALSAFTSSVSGCPLGLFVVRHHLLCELTTARRCRGELGYGG
jgi:hypothetical protein